MKCAKFAEIGKTIDKINEILGNCDIYENSLAHKMKSREIIQRVR